MRPSLRVLLGPLFLCACAHGPVRIAQKMGVSGWAQVDRSPPREGGTYGERFTTLPLEGGDALSCAELKLAPSGPLYVFVHGVGGDGQEWVDNLPLLMASKPAAAFMFRWVPYDERDPIAERFGKGVSKLLSCGEGRPVLVLAHSAGGVVASFGASRIIAPPGAKEGLVSLITVASPLAGNVRRAGNEGGRAEAKFMLDLGSSIRAYPAAPAVVRAVHLRTHYPADRVMKPNGDFVPNDPRVGIPGARQVDLPDELGHVSALSYAAQRVADGRWVEWFTSP